MEFTVFAYQINPGFDHLLHFATSLDECVEAAKQQREELNSVEEGIVESLGAMAVYECRMRVPDAQTFIDVLNNPDDEFRLFTSCVVGRQLVALVAD